MKEAAQRYTIELTSDEITELVAAAHSRQYSMQDAIVQAKLDKQTVHVVETLEQRLELIKAVTDRIRNADRE